MGFNTIKVTRTTGPKVADPKVVIDFNKGIIRVNRRLYDDLQLKKYPHITLAYDPETNALALMRGAAKKETTYKMNPTSMSVKSGVLVNELKQLTNIIEGTQRLDAVVQQVQDTPSAVVTFARP